VNSPTTGGVFCECVAYIQNHFHITHDFVSYAYQMGSELSANQFRPVTTPTVGAVVVFGQNFGQGIGSAGHVGIVQSVGHQADGSVVLSVQGSNQRNNPTTEFTDSGCNNVDRTSFTIAPDHQSKITYWVK